MSNLELTCYVVAGFLVGVVVLADASRREREAIDKVRRDAYDSFCRDWLEAHRENVLRGMQAEHRLLTQGRRYKPASDHMAPVRRGTVTQLRAKRA